MTKRLDIIFIPLEGPTLSSCGYMPLTSGISMQGLRGVDEVCLSAKHTRLTWDSSSSAEVGSTAKPNA